MKKSRYKTNMNSSVDKKVRNRKNMEEEKKCVICSPNKGCNGNKQRNYKKKTRKFPRLYKDRTELNQEEK